MNDPIGRHLGPLQQVRFAEVVALKELKTFIERLAILFAGLNLFRQQFPAEAAQTVDDLPALRTAAGEDIELDKVGNFNQPIPSRVVHNIVESYFVAKLLEPPACQHNLVARLDRFKNFENCVR